MQVILVKDGTVPMALAKVIATDGDQDVADFIEANDPNSDLSYLIEAFTIPDDTTYLGVTWADGEGFNVLPFTSINDALKTLNWAATPEAIATSYVDTGHWAVTYNPGDDESYGHVFAL